MLLNKENKLKLDKYLYIGRDDTGMEQRGSVRASDRTSAIAEVRRLGLIPVAIGKTMDNNAEDDANIKISGTNNQVACGNGTVMQQKSHSTTSSKQTTEFIDNFCEAFKKSFSKVKFSFGCSNGCWILTLGIIAIRALQPNAVPMSEWSIASWILMTAPIWISAGISFIVIAAIAAIAAFALLWK